MKKLLALALCAVLLLGLALPAGAILEFIILDEVLDIINPTDPPPPVATPEPSEPGFNFSPDFDLDVPLPIFTAEPTLGVFQTPGPLPTIRIPLPTSPPAQVPTPDPAPTGAPATGAPTKKPAPGQSGGSLTGMELTSFGLYFEDFRPRLTDEWYMFTPIDLNNEGVLTYPLVAGNAWIVGSVTITARKGFLKVEYEAVKGVKVNREFFTVVGSLDELKTLNPAMLDALRMRFNQSVNIAEAFGNDRLVVLYLNNTADFKTNLAGITPFVPEQHQLFMQNLIGLVD